MVVHQFSESIMVIQEVEMFLSSSISRKFKNITCDHVHSAVIIKVSEQSYKLKLLTFSCYGK